MSHKYSFIGFLYCALVKPTRAGALKNIKAVRAEFGQRIAIIGCGGIFTPADAKEMLAAGADLVQLITGMIYEGPQIVGEIVESL